MFCGRCFTKVIAADLHFLVQEIMAYYNTQGSRKFSIMVNLCDQTKSDILSLFFFSYLFFSFKKTVKPNMSNYCHT
jgi:hypothetical protein